MPPPRAVSFARPLTLLPSPLGGEGWGVRGCLAPLAPGGRGEQERRELALRPSPLADNLHIPLTPRAREEALRRRDMDVFCIGMYRSGSTWQYHIVGHLLEKHRGGRRLGIVTGPEYARAAPGAPDGW